MVKSLSVEDKEFIASNYRKLTDAKIADLLGCSKGQVIYYRYSNDLIRRQRTKANICFDCANAIDGCSWSRDFEPVHGWQATPVKLKVNDYAIDTFSISDCPEFVSDRVKK